MWNAEIWRLPSLVILYVHAKPFRRAKHWLGRSRSRTTSWSAAISVICIGSFVIAVLSSSESVKMVSSLRMMGFMVLDPGFSDLHRDQRVGGWKNGTDQPAR